MLQQIEGSAAVAKAVAMCRPEVIAAYPITPQTHIVEGLGEMVKRGQVGSCQFMNVESEFGAMSTCIGSSAAGARTYTATSSQGMLFMMEAVYNASGMGLPIVMTVGNRAIGPPISIPKYAVSQVIGFIKGKSAIHIARVYSERKRNYVGQHFWARGYFVSTVGRDEEVIREYIRHQEREDRRVDQLNLM